MLLIRTRFTWYYILVLSLIAFYSIIAIPFDLENQSFFYSTLYFSGVFGVFAIVSATMGGISVSKSDQEFLLVSAIPKKELAVSLMIVQALGTGILLIAVSIFALTIIDYSGIHLALAILNLILLDLIMLTIGISTFRLPRKYKAVAGAAIGLWVLSYFVGFPLAPQGFITGNPVYPLMLTAPVTALIIFGAYLTLRSEDLPIRVSTRKEPRKEYRSAVNYTKYSPRMAVFMNSFTNLSYSTNSLMAGGIRTTIGRVRMRTYYVIIVAISLIYGFLAYFLIRYGIQADGFNQVVLFGSLYAGVLPQFVFNSGAMTYERAWLSFTSFEPWRYISILVSAKIVQSVLTSIPFLLVSLVDYYLGVYNTIESLFVFAVIDPLMIGLYLYIVFSYSYYQITDEGYLSTRMSAAQFVQALPLIVFTLIVMMSIIFPVLIVFTALGTMAIIYLFATRKEFWERRINKLIENGFV